MSDRIPLVASGTCAVVGRSLPRRVGRQVLEAEGS
jgi:hypothetical protein